MGLRMAPHDRTRQRPTHTGRSRRRLAVVAAGLFCAAACADDPAAFRLEPETTSQTISGWEVTLRFWEFDKARDRYDGSWLARRDDLVHALVEQAGVNRVRIEVRSGIENPVDYWEEFVAGRIGYAAVKEHFYEKINDNDDPAYAKPEGFQWSSFDYYVENLVLPMRKALEARGERLVINLCYVDFRWTKAKGSLSHADTSEEYAELVSLAAERLRARYGLAPDYVELILEPDNSDRWTGERIGRAMIALQRRLSASGMAPRFIAPSTAHASNAARFLDGIASIPGAADLLDIASYHRYDGSAANGALAGIRARAEHQGWEIAMLEHLDSGPAELLTDLTDGNAVAWQQYGVATLADSAGGAKSGYLLLAAPDGGPVTLSPVGAQLALLFSSVREGAVRIGLQSAPRRGGVRAAAFRNPDGSIVIAAYAKSGRQIEISNAPGITYQLSLAGPDAKTPLISQIRPDADGVLRLALPPDSMGVLHGDRKAGQ